MLFQTESTCLMFCCSLLVLASKCTADMRMQYMCSELEDAIDDYFARDAFDFTLYQLMGFDVDYFVDATKQFSGEYDFHDEDERYEFACALSRARSQEQLNTVLDQTFGDSFSQFLRAPIVNHRYSIGSVARLDELAELYIKLLAWADRNDYPNLPLSRVNRTDTMLTFTEAHRAMEKSYLAAFVKKDVLPFPVRMRPYTATTLMENAQSYEGLEQRLGVSPGSLKLWAQLSHTSPALYRYMARDIDKFMEFIHALQETGHFT